MTIIRFLILSFLFLLWSCSSPVIDEAQKDQPLINYVNPFIGTGGHGHTYPGATMPFGMVQLSPDTRLDGWDGCSGYHYDDTYIYGFSHTHLSGTGVSDYGDILLMPTTSVQFNNGANGEPGYRAPFKHDHEEASPGYYKVHLDSTNIDVELTVTPRAGMHKYAFAKAEDQYIILDLEHRDKLLDGDIKTISNTEIQGHRFSEAWAKEQKLFFYLKTSHPFSVSEDTYNDEYVDIASPNKVALQFDNPNNEPIYVSVGISAVDEAGAKQNLETEIGDNTFEEIKQLAQDTWEQQLSKIVVEDDNQEHKINFYTSLYHTMLAPNVYQDVDGRYRGMDLAVHKTQDFDYYTVFSLWDTYRAAHPLYTIIEQERTNDFINTFLAKYDEGGIIPIWDLSANYTGCMIGYHGIPVIADAYLKGIQDYDTEKAFEAMTHSAMQDHLGLDAYRAFGYIPVEEESESVSKTLEYAYDDWTIAQMAKAMGKSQDYTTYIQRAQYYKNTFDPATQFMRARMRNTWFSPFDPYEVNFNYTEANAWQYSFYVPQDISGFTQLLGGKSALENQLDELFTANAETSGRNQADITGLIGQYAHGNEPSHHMAYLYNFINKPAKTQERVHEILTTLYHNAPDGISGNEDCGQMSAWYVLSSLGFYPVTPGSNQYIIGSPLFNKATIHLENGKSFTIAAQKETPDGIYIADAKLNDAKHPYSYIDHETIMTGGQLAFTMSTTPSDWATQDDAIPKTEITDHPITPVPFIAKGDIAFKEQTQVELATTIPDATIFYAFDKDDFKEYNSSLTINQPTTLKTYAVSAGIESATVTTPFYKINPNLKITLGTTYANQYNAGGNDALIDGIRGTRDFRTGTWQGYHDRDVVATIDLGKVQDINEVTANFLQDQGSWIFYPTTVTIAGSVNGKQFTTLKTYTVQATDRDDEAQIKSFSFQGDSTYRYIKLTAKKLGKLPDWHLGYPLDGRSWIFIDEIDVR